MDWEIVLVIAGFMLASPFAGVGLFFFARTKRKEHKALKKAIKSGQWTQDFNYTFTGKYKVKLDKYIYKSEKKQRKLLKKENKESYNNIEEVDTNVQTN